MTFIEDPEYDVCDCENCHAVTDIPDCQIVRGLRVCPECAESAPDAEVIDLAQLRAQRQEHGR